MYLEGVLARDWIEVLQPAVPQTLLICFKMGVTFAFSSPWLSWLFRDDGILPVASGSSVNIFGCISVSNMDSETFKRPWAACCGWPDLEQGEGRPDLQRLPSTSACLWLCICPAYLSSLLLSTKSTLHLHILHCKACCPVLWVEQSNTS